MFRWMVVLLVLAVLPAQARTDGFRQVDGDCRLEFPRDHGAHPGFRTEWWYYTGNLEAPDGRHFGFQFTVFRRQLKPDGEAAPIGGRRSAWRTRQIYFGHAAVADISSRRHLQAETLARGMGLLAGVELEGDETRVFLKGWQAVIGPTAHELTVEDPAFGYHLDLAAEKPPVRHGRNGFSRKGAALSEASCYYSFTRMRVSGTLRVGGRSVAVRGRGWMDHEFSSAYLAAGLSGWDWFSIQLSDGSEVMIFALRQADGTASPFSSGTFVGRDGTGRHLDSDDLRLEPGGIWHSPSSGIGYPLRWKIRVRSLELELGLAAAFAEQEMQTAKTTGVTYWEGSVHAAGTRGGRPVEGWGYLEMTGRGAKGFEAPL